MAYLISEEAQDLLKDVKKFCDNEVREQCKEYDKMCDNRNNQDLRRDRKIE